MKKALSAALRAFNATGSIIALAVFCLIGVLLLQGCSVKKIEYEKNDKGEISYRIYENDHWLKTESTGIKGGMTDDGKFVFEAEGMKSSPSEEFNRTMQTYTTAFVQLAQIAAAAYNPSSSGVIATKAATSAATTTSATTATAATSAATPATATTNAAECVDCKEPAK